MAIRQGRCTNFGNCSTADEKQIVQTLKGGDFACTECGRSLTEMKVSGRSGSAKPTLLAIIALPFVLGVVVGWGTLKQKETPAPPPPDEILRIAGSKTIGTELGPALAVEFLKQQGATDVKVMPAGVEDEKVVLGILPGMSSPARIRIAAHGSATAFSGLANNSCDIGMSSRKIKPDEASKLSALGDMTSFTNEHVLGLDGIAVIVNGSNPLVSITKDQLTSIFSGRIREWSQVSTQNGAIKIYARDDKSGTFDTFKTLVLAGASLDGAAKRFEDSNALSDAVASDPDGIGFVGLPYVRSAKAIAISEHGATPLQPNRLTVGTEDYPLSRRLYLYTPTSPKSKYARQFVEFATSTAGQNIVGKTGFIAQNVIPISIPTNALVKNAPVDYTNLTNGADRLSLDFRFRTGSSELDNKALVDLDRVVAFVSDLKWSGDRILLLGFADSTGSPPTNLELSQRRADAIEEQFRHRGVKPGLIKGFGSSLPVASNDTAEGREKNRRVEIWVRK